MSYLRRRQLRPSRNTVRPTLIKAVFGLILPMINPIIHTVRAETGADMGDPAGRVVERREESPDMREGVKMKITPVKAPETIFKSVEQLDIAFTGKPKTYYVNDGNEVKRAAHALNLMNGGAQFTALETQGVVPLTVNPNDPKFKKAVQDLQDKLIELKLLKKSDLEFPVQPGENTAILQKQGIDLTKYFYGKLNQATVDAWYEWTLKFNGDGKKQTGEIQEAGNLVQSTNREEVMTGLGTYARYGMMTTVVAVASKLVEKSDDIKLLERLSEFCAEQLYVCRDKGYKKQEKELSQLFDRITKKMGEIAGRKVEAAKRIEEKALKQADRLDQAIVALSKKNDRGKALLDLDA